MSSFDAGVPFGRYDIGFVGGDSLSFPVLFDIDITGIDFEFFLWPNVGGTKILSLTNGDPGMSIVVGDPVSVQNSVTVEFDETVTGGWDFDCVQYRLRWDFGEGFRTLLVGDVSRVA